MKDTTIEELEREGYEGSDVSLDIALFEYGLIWLNTKEGKTIFIYALPHTKEEQAHTYYDRAEFDTNTDVYHEWNWAEWDNLFIYAGITKAQYDKLEFHDKVYLLHSFYGSEEIFGSTYWHGAKIPDPDNPYPEENEDE